MTPPYKSHLNASAVLVLTSAKVALMQSFIITHFHERHIDSNKACLTFLRDSNNGNLTAFWNAYIVTMEVVLELIWASRERDRMLHLNFNHAVTPWTSLHIGWTVHAICLLNAQMMHFPDNHIHLKNGGSEWMSRHLRKIKWSKRWIKTRRKR